jgi:hypothetical protein
MHADVIRRGGRRRGRSRVGTQQLTGSGCCGGGGREGGRVGIFFVLVLFELRGFVGEEHFAAAGRG